MPREEKDTAIIVFTKFPVEGKVKTRLAKNMGNKFAVSFYRVCAEHTFKELLKEKNKIRFSTSQRIAKSKGNRHRDIFVLFGGK